MNALFTLIVSVLISSVLMASPAQAACTQQMELTGTIGPASQDLLERGLLRAKENHCDSLLVLINTPGGSLQTTRTMVELILNSPIPILCLVSPSGGHAGSAGAIILQACHVNGAMVATNLGAATPIMGNGANIPEDLRKKILNDTKSWMDSIIKLRGRNARIGAEFIDDAKSVSAEEAKKQGAIDVVVAKVDEFLGFANGREVKMTESKTQKVETGDLKVFQKDLRYEALSLFADPETAYLLMMGSLALLYFEVTHPGTMVPGVLGGIGLILSSVALQKLNVQWAGVALILLALGLMIAEAYVTSFGILGVGGIAAFIIGSLFLFDPAQTGGYRLPLSLILPTALILGSVMLAVAFLVMRTFKVRRRGGFDDMVGEKAHVVSVSGNKQSGQIEIAGETWNFESHHPLEVGHRVRVTGHRGLTLLVTSAQEA